MLHELSVGALFGYSALVHHDNVVGILHGGQSVGYHEHGFPASKVGKCLPDKVLVFGVGKGSSFVEHHDGRIFQNGTGKHYALLFAAGEVCSLRSYHGVQSLW